MLHPQECTLKTTRNIYHTIWWNINEVNAGVRQHITQVDCRVNSRELFSAEEVTRLHHLSAAVEM